MALDINKIYTSRNNGIRHKTLGTRFSTYIMCVSIMSYVCKYSRDAGFSLGILFPVSSLPPEVLYTRYLLRLELPIIIPMLPFIASLLIDGRLSSP